MARDDIAKAKGRTAAIVAAAVAAMIGASYAAVPLYRMFCAATGYGGKTLDATTGPAARGARTFTVAFDADVAGALPIEVTPETRHVAVRDGATTTVYYKFANRTDREVWASASDNVAPDYAGGYFDKLKCFCTSVQRFGPGETRELPVVFYLDAALEKDAGMAGISTLTLHYTLYPASASQIASAKAAGAGS
ncbi:MAG: cytochrome c oxidase assembly protein [Hyphomicrobiales bacterium]|nr:cytochrome c oxidase assembly protein [Hyphomicrobiales bacterium]MDE2016386.1 cytochrome c oxidase assembly protein [Hyphomicrobiales bacterium]